MYWLVLYILKCVMFKKTCFRYETCAWGWNKERKVEEMTDDNAWYLIAKSKSGSLLAFSHFRFDMDFGEPVLYW